LLAIFTARKFSKGLSEPIQQLTQAMQKVAAGDLAALVEIVARDEIKFLVDAFNKMIQDLNTSQQKLIQTERIAAWRDVARRISHEIKNSLTPIQMAFYRLRTKISIQPADREIFDKAIATINEEIESLRRLADEFSQFARMPQPQREAANLNEIMSSTVILFEAEPHNVKLKLELNENLPAIALDREQIKRVLNNLLKNSVEASPRGGVIILRTEHSTEPPHRVRLKLVDHGDGIPPEKLDKIFEPYFTTKESGRGLGLSIVKRIIEDHDGKIAITSKVGVGTEVTIWL
jgi:nitrogen fixation/metabolism regulation signal transduction histidine kinase